MSDDELDLIIRKKHKIKKLLLARERVRKLEKELCGDSTTPENPPQVPQVPQFLLAPTDNFFAASRQARLSLSRHETAALTPMATDSVGSHRSIQGFAGTRPPLIHDLRGRIQEPVELRLAGY
jgi:hypothetical protein